MDLDDLIGSGPKTSEFPMVQWSNVVRLGGLSMGLDRVLDAHYSTGIYCMASEGGPSTLNNRVAKTHGGWTISLHTTLEAMSFAILPRRGGYLTWKDYISRFFTAIQPRYHSRTIVFDSAARHRAVNQKHPR